MPPISSIVKSAYLVLTMLIHDGVTATILGPSL